ncbi:MAG: RNA polymerase sigma factor [Planctomycetota bacterium]
MQLALFDFGLPTTRFSYGVSAWLNQSVVFAVRSDESEPVKPELETHWIDAARKGDEDAFRMIVAEYQPALVSQMRRFSRDANVVGVLVHDVFVEVFLSLDRFRGNSPFEHWVRKIAVRVGYRHWKREAREKSRVQPIGSEEDFEATHHHPSSAIEAREQLHRMLGKLSPRDRLVLTLLYWDGHSVAEAARLSGWTQAMVKVQAHRARKRLRNLFEESNETRASS